MYGLSSKEIQEAEPLNSKEVQPLEIKKAIKMEKKPFRFDFSAGGIVSKKEKSKIFILLVQHAGHKGWCFPKGLIEKHEKKEEAALREVLEEGGVRAKIIKEAGTTEYFYVENEIRVKKKVYYYLMEYESGEPQNHDWEMMDAKWVEKEKVWETLTYKSDKMILEKIEKELI